MGEGGDRVGGGRVVGWGWGGGGGGIEVGMFHCRPLSGEDSSTVSGILSIEPSADGSVSFVLEPE